jgi:hypothetical protein
MNASAVLSFSDAELATASEVLRTLAGSAPPAPPRRRRPRSKLPGAPRRQPRNLANGQYVKSRRTDPYGTPLPSGVCWFAGIDPGYTVEVECWGRSISLTVPYRLYPGCEGIRVALAQKATLVHIRETVPADCIERFAWAVVGLGERVEADAGWAAGCSSGDESG